jgi:hypothetical protein
MPEKQNLADNPGFRRAMAIFIAAMFVLMVVALFRTDLTPEDTRHDHFAAALWPGFRFEREKAVLYKDPDHPLTWHVCTATGCGRYFEDEGDAEKSR